MPNPISGPDTSTGPWGQAKKTETQPTTGTTGTSTATETATPSETAPSVDSGASAAPAEGGGGTTASAPSTANQVSPMPDSLRTLIAEYGRSDGPAPTALHDLTRRLAEAHETLPEVEETLELVQRTRAEIVAAASMSMRAQATQTQQSVLAILRRE